METLAIDVTNVRDQTGTIGTSRYGDASAMTTIFPTVVNLLSPVAIQQIAASKIFQGNMIFGCNATSETED